MGDLSTTPEKRAEYCGEEVAPVDPVSGEQADRILTAKWLRSGQPSVSLSWVQSIHGVCKVHHERSAISCIQVRQDRWHLIMILQSLSFHVLLKSTAIQENRTHLTTQSLWTRRWHVLNS